MRIINTKKSEKKIKKLPQPVLERIDTAQSISVLGALGNLLDLFEFCLFDYFRFTRMRDEEKKHFSFLSSKI